MKNVVLATMKELQTVQEKNIQMNVVNARIMRRKDVMFVVFMILIFVMMVVDYLALIS